MRTATPRSTRPAFRLALAVWVSFAMVAATVALNGHGATSRSASGADAVKKAYAASAANAVARKSAYPVVFNADGTHTHLPGTPTHDHSNPATKNLVSRVTAAEADGDITD